LGREKFMKGKDTNTWSSCLALHTGDLTNDPKERPKQIYLYRVFRKWSFEQISNKLKIPEAKAIREFESYTEGVLLPASAKGLEGEVSFCEEQIRILLKLLKDIFRLKRSKRIYLSNQVVGISKAIYQWEDLICKLRGHLLPSALLQQLIEERQKSLKNLPQLSSTAQEKIYRILREDRISDDQSPFNTQRFGLK
jgi:hypothetical protein